jgi:ABC-type sulfate transport system permease subunit
VAAQFSFVVARHGAGRFQQKDVWLRTAVDVGSEGWAHFDYVKMPDYRWGIFLEPADADAKVGLAITTARRLIRKCRRVS